MSKARIGLLANRYNQAKERYKKTRKEEDRRVMRNTANELSKLGEKGGVWVWNLVNLWSWEESQKFC